MRDEQSRQRSTEVIIDGKVIPLAGGDSAYLRQVAAYIDNKIAELRQNRAYARQNSERRAQILWLNLADDCLQARAESAELKEEAAAEGKFLRPRFSPGYGDLPLAIQPELFRVLEVQKNTGITLTESLLMMPTKSVTALIGVSTEDSHCLIQGCESCGKRDCSFRR